MRRVLISLAVLFGASAALARSVRVDACLADLSVGGLCVVETAFGLVVVALLLLAASFILAKGRAWARGTLLPPDRD